MIGYDFVMDCAKISLEYFEHDNDSNKKDYTDGHSVTLIYWKIAKGEFIGEDTQPQHAHLINKERFFYPSPKMCTLWRCLVNCEGC